MKIRTEVIANSYEWTEKSTFDTIKTIVNQESTFNYSTKLSMMTLLKGIEDMIEFEGELKTSSVWFCPLCKVTLW